MAARPRYYRRFLRRPRPSIDSPVRRRYRRRAIRPAIVHIRKHDATRAAVVRACTAIAVGDRIAQGHDGSGVRRGLDIHSGYPVEREGWTFDGVYFVGRDGSKGVGTGVRGVSARGHVVGHQSQILPAPLASGPTDGEVELTALQKPPQANAVFREVYCFGPIVGPIPTAKYPGGGVPPLASQKARAIDAMAFTAATSAGDLLAGTTTVEQLVPTLPAASIARTTLR